MGYDPEAFKAPSIASFRLKGHTLQQAKQAREHAINTNAKLRSSIQAREERSALAKGIEHTSKETERGEHKPEVGGYKDHNHSGDK
jgi:hypothetical protein